MKRICFLVLVLGLASFGVGACGKPPPMTLSDFRWQCNFAGSGGGSDSDRFGGGADCDSFTQARICQDYSNRIEAFSGNLEECLDMCRDADRLESGERVYHWSCQGVVREVASLCTRYCRRNYYQ